MAAANTKTQSRRSKERFPQIHLRIVFPDYNAVGPYGTSFLEAIRQHRSISAAATAKGITNRQAGVIARNLNTLFQEPLIATRQGRGGGAWLTPLGLHVISLYRDAEKKADRALRYHTQAFSELRRKRRA